MNNQLHHEYYNAKQLKLPLQLEIIIPFDSEVRTFDEVFNKVEVNKYLVSKEKGRKGYNLINMLKLVLFCHMEQIYSLRDMEKAAKNDIRLMWLTDETKPSYVAIGDFINNHLKENIQLIFKEFNDYFIDKDNINTDIIYIDGTKIESKSNKYKFIWRGSIEKYQSSLYKKITKTIDKLNDEFKYENISFDTNEIYKPSYLNSIITFLNKDIIKKDITLVFGSGKKKTSLQRRYDELKEYITKLIEYQNHLDIMGPNRNSYSKTDHSATFMRMKEDHMRNGQLKPGYNIQIGVSDEYIIHLMVSQERSDFGTFQPFLNSYEKLHGKFPTYPVADAGYGSLDNYRYLKDNKMELFQKYSMFEKDTTDKKRIKDEYMPHNLIEIDEHEYDTVTGERLEYLYTDKFNRSFYYSFKAEKKIMINKENVIYQKEVIKNLKSPLGIELRVQRSIQVEGAFGVIKSNYGVRRFRRTTMQNVELEITLIAIGYNLLKYHNRKYKLIQ